MCVRGAVAVGGWPGWQRQTRPSAAQAQRQAHLSRPPQAPPAGARALSRARATQPPGRASHARPRTWLVPNGRAPPIAARRARACSPSCPPAHPRLQRPSRVYQPRRPALCFLAFFYHRHPSLRSTLLPSFQQLISHPGTKPPPKRSSHSFRGPSHCHHHPPSHASPCASPSLTPTLLPIRRRTPQSPLTPTTVHTPYSAEYLCNYRHRHRHRRTAIRNIDLTSGSRPLT